MTGILNLDKPPRLSSAAALNRLKRVFPRGTKIGHAGTLDPFATGVLVVLIGRATKLCEHFMSLAKQYDATIKLGATTETLDPESPEIPTMASGAMNRTLPMESSEIPGPIITLPDRDAIESILPRFVGLIDQMPPVFSALKINGRRACDRTRDGQTVELQPRKVQVHGIQILDYTFPSLRLLIDCGRGTYVRSMARDIAAALDTTGYLTALRRTAVGPCHIDQATPLDTLLTNGPEKYLLPAPVL